MATIGVGAGSYMRPRYSCRTRSFPVDVSQTIIVGDLLVLSADSDEGNRVKKSGADPTTDRGVVGIAAEAITTTATHVAATDKVLVWLAEQGTEFVAHVCGAAFADETLDNDDISVEFGLLEDTVNHVWRVDTSETTAKLVRVLELLDTHGDTNGRVAVHFIAPERLYGD